MIKQLSLLLFLFIFLAGIAKAQNWGGGIDGEQFNWGFSFQANTSEYKITKTRNWRDPYFDEGLGKYVTNPLSSIAAVPTMGFGIGFVLNSKVTNNLDVRFTPTLVFNDRVINYNYVFPSANNVMTEPLIQKKVQATMVELPLGLKLKSDRLLNFRAYLLGGLKYSMDLASGKKNNDADAAPINKLLKNKQNYLSYEAGAGFDIYFEYFKMSPEVKLSYSFNDVLKHDANPYSNPIDKAKLRHFTFSLFFE
jgi:hypothetical protein